MTRKDFELIADTIKHAQGLDEGSRKTMAGEFAHALASTNGRFDKARFLRACGF